MTRAEILNCLTDRPCEVCKFHSDGHCSAWNCVFEEKPDEKEDCEDAISRQAAIEEMECCDFTMSASDDVVLYEDSVIEVLKSLPSVTPKKKMGRWIKSDAVLVVGYTDTFLNLPAEECSVCHKPHIRGYGKQFCPNCGAKMAESEVSE